MRACEVRLMGCACRQKVLCECELWPLPDWIVVYCRGRRSSSTDTEGESAVTSMKSAPPPPGLYPLCLRTSTPRTMTNTYEEVVAWAGKPQLSGTPWHHKNSLVIAPSRMFWSSISWSRLVDGGSCIPDKLTCWHCTGEQKTALSKPLYKLHKTIT